MRVIPQIFAIDYSLTANPIKGPNVYFVGAYIRYYESKIDTYLTNEHVLA